MHTFLLVLPSDPTYTSSPDTPNPNQDTSLNEEPRGVMPDEPVFLIPNNEVNQLRWHTRAYLKSIGQIPTIYQIPRAWSSQRRNQPYGDNETLAATIDDLIIDTISKIRELIETIENQEDLEFQNFLISLKWILLIKTSLKQRKVVLDLPSLLKAILLVLIHHLQDQILAF
jgi:hypothetical protein